MRLKLPVIPCAVAQTKKSFYHISLAWLSTHYLNMHFECLWSILNSPSLCILVLKIINLVHVSIWGMNYKCGYSDSITDQTHKTGHKAALLCHLHF